MKNVLLWALQSPNQKEKIEFGSELVEKYTQKSFNARRSSTGFRADLCNVSDAELVQ